MKKELTSFVALVFLATSVILGILFIDVKRQVISQSRQFVSESNQKVIEKKAAVLPSARTYSEEISLPKPKIKGTLSVEKALNERRTIRVFKDAPLTLAQVSQMLWSAQGITDPATGKRVAPSAYEVYPFTVYMLVRNVTGLAPGLYEYLPKSHALGDLKLEGANELFANAGVQEGAKKAPVTFILAASLDKGLEKLKAGTMTSTYLEGGHIGQNMYLQAQSLKLGLVVMGGAGKTSEALKLDKAETVVYIIPVGVPAPVTEEVKE